MIPLGGAVERFAMRFVRGRTDKSSVALLFVCLSALLWLRRRNFIGEVVGGAAAVNGGDGRCDGAGDGDESICCSARHVAKSADDEASGGGDTGGDVKSAAEIGR